MGLALSRKQSDPKESPYETPSSSFHFDEVSIATQCQVPPSTIPGYFSGCVVQIHLH